MEPSFSFVISFVTTACPPLLELLLFQGTSQTLCGWGGVGAGQLTVPGLMAQVTEP